jgi:DNA segregation ATPase FtsK/SpoIIIE, S-DNA-T family
MSWIKKLMNTFFDENDEESFDYEKDDKPSSKQGVTEREESPKKLTRSSFKNSGRTTSQNHSQASAKMLHKYPESGPFRFPVIPDETTVKSQATNHTYKPRERQPEKERVQRETRNRSERRQRSLEETEVKRPVPRAPFKATHVPSPVYGYDKRNKPSSNGETKQPEPPEVKSRFTPTDVPSPVYGFGKRKPEGILFIGRDIPAPNSLTERLLKDVEDGPNKLPEEIEAPFAQTGITGIDTSGDEELEVLEPFQHESDLVIESIEYAAEEYESVQQKTFVEQESASSAVEEDSFYQEDSEEIVTYEDEFVRNEEEAGYEEDKPSFKVPEKEPIKAAPAINRQNTPRTGGQYVPFNVLMLKKDRQETGGQPRQQAAPAQSVAAPVIQEREERTPPGQLSVPISLLKSASFSLEDDDIWLNEKKETLQSTLDNFNVNARVVHMTKGPAVTRFEVQPAPGVKVNKITNLTDDIKLSLAARDIRIEAPIPGKNAIGIEVPNQHSRAVFLREILENKVFKESPSSLTVALGLDISGAPVVTDLQKMPHGLIAGATGSGKSVCINSILVSLLYKATPDEVRLLLVDPKMVELAPYNHIPHLVTPVITDAKEATAALKWAVEEMERRYEGFAKTGVRDIKRYNEKMEQERLYQNKLPYIVVVIDELADLMMVSPQEVEEAICRIAQKARACGIHLLLATQRPSVDVITGLIKANVPTRTAFAVSSAIDSRTILDMSGAERLLGRGDMLFMENGSNKAVRIQGTFVSDEEIEEVTRYVKEEYETDYLFTREELIQHQQSTDVEDELFEEACFYVIEVGAASSSSLQRRFRIGYNRAARLVEMMESFGLVSEAMGSKPRHVLLSQEEFENRLYSQVD